MKKLTPFFLILPFLLIGAGCTTTETTTVQTPPSTQSGTTTAVEVTSDTTTETYTLAEVEQHATEDDCWYAVDGDVYDITDYIANENHKAGMEIVIEYCGMDASRAFLQGHGQGRKGQAAYSQLDEYIIGTLAE